MWFFNRNKEAGDLALRLLKEKSKNKKKINEYKMEMIKLYKALSDTRKYMMATLIKYKGEVVLEKDIIDCVTPNLSFSTEVIDGTPGDERVILIDLTDEIEEIKNAQQ